MEKVFNLIEKLYNTNDGGCGGYGHIVFDDGNLSDREIKFCIEAAKKRDFEFISEETRLNSLIALKAMLALNDEEREKVYSLYYKYSKKKL